MARNIDFTKPLSEEDLGYIQDRPWLIADLAALGVDIERQAEDEELEEEEEGEADVVNYANFTAVELKSEIEDRNEDRDDDRKITPASGRKDDLIAALEEDDEEEDEEEE